MAGALAALLVLSSESPGQECSTFPAKLRAAFESRGVSIEFYEVYGATPGEIRRSMDRARPSDNFGRRFDGWTRWRVAWTWRYISGRPDFSRTKIETEVAVTLPCLRSSPVPDTWRDFLAAAAKHELGHVEIVQSRHAAMLGALISRSKTELSFSTDDAEAFLQSELAAIRREDERFDDRTRHGQLEGVWFPGT